MPRMYGIPSIGNSLKITQPGGLDMQDPTQYIKTSGRMLPVDTAAYRYPKTVAATCQFLPRLWNVGRYYMHQSMMPNWNKDKKKSRMIIILYAKSGGGGGIRG